MAKRPRDLNQLAKLVVDIASGDVEDSISPQMRAPEAVKGRAGGLKGGIARAASMTPNERRDVAKAAALKRWER